MKPQSQKASGNALLIVLIGIALFAALMFVITRENKYDTGSSERAAIDAQQITSYAEKINGAVQNLLTQNHCAITQISFLNSTGDGYSNGTDLASCKIFDKTGYGGGMTLQTPPAEAVDTASATADSSALAGSYYFEGNVAVTNAGTSSPDIIFVMPFVTQAVCAQINLITSGSTTIPTVAADAYDGAKFAGTLASTYSLTTSTNTNPSGCFQVTGGFKPGNGYHYYSVLVAN